MYSKLQEVKYSPRQQENNILNACCGVHDLACGCKDPLKCVATLIFFKAEPTNFNKEEKKQILKCLGMEDTAIDGGDRTTADADIGPGDLDLLFAEDGDGEG